MRYKLIDIIFRLRDLISSKYSYLFPLLIITCLGCDCNQVKRTPSMEELVQLRVSQMLSDIQQYGINSEKAEFMVSSTQALDDSAVLYQTKIQSILTNSVLAAYRAERESFAVWYDYQHTISEEVVGEIWELSWGGSAGSSFQNGHLYDIANANAAEQELLYDAIVGKTNPEICHENASIQQIDSTKAQLSLEFRNLYSQYENIGPDGWPAVKITPSQLDALLDADFEMFVKWMSVRELLEPLLDKKVRHLFASHTAYWKYIYQKKCKERYIGE